MFDPFTLNEQEKSAYKQAGGFTLTPPESARPVKRGKVWSELLVVKDIKWIEPGVQTPDHDDDETFAIQFAFVVSPESEQDGERSPNVGRPVSAWMKFNLPAWRRDSGKGQGKMTDISFAGLRGFLRASGQDEVHGMNPKALTDGDLKPELLGARLWGTVTQRELEDGRTVDEVSRFIPEQP
jgi:hypothetical protein